MTKIGRYEVETEIGRGAMGVVYRAVDPELTRVVAVKTYTLPPGLDEAHAQEFRRRFRREAQAAASLSHPGIVTVYDAGEDPGSGLPFIAMEYVPGLSLAQVLAAERRLPLDRVRAMAGELAGALGAAHAAGIVHRDIKPANVLIREGDGAAKIADFGVARVTTSTLTQSGASVGSPAYMSPEQIRGRGVDGRSDLFSLATILYEALCGVRPFDGAGVSEVLYAVVHGTPVPVSRRDAELPASLDRFFDRALAKDPNERFADAAAFAEAFSEAASGEGADDAAFRTIVAPAAGPPRLRRRVALAAAAAVVALVSGWAIFGRSDAHLKLEGKSRLDGELTLTVDGEAVYARTLAAPQHPEGQRPGLLKKISESIGGSDFETFEALIALDSGTHEIEATITTERGEPYRSAVVVELERGETRRLKLVAGRSVGSTLSLRAD